ncbi:DsbA family oxidoreductase [Alkalihalobacterium alkalinitrilicum]|uniref:DsbA family oxidoreductase n=1 Tax=Alkalihalobacterium alkalinitrilicum TaxID=427920 RepID=UPI000994F367|nr:DsbA family oxidoreductase [Alkalihalobacterium alkalinitrilicum]
MKIEVWSDYVCPFCYIGKRRLESALEKFPQKDQVKIEFKSFELDPHAQRDTTGSVYENLSKKYGMSIEETKKMTEGVAAQAKSVGLDFDFDSMIRTNTLDAHRIAKFAEKQGKDKAVTETLLRAHFIEAKHIGDHETLADLAVITGLNRQEVEEVLKGNAYEEEVRADQFRAKDIGVQGVPFFVINEKYAISGAQPTETFLNALQKVWEEENEEVVLKPISTANHQGAMCTDDHCES